ncbi:hypothetical protein [Actinospica sp.]|uniref:hypothetical protein n=1 Tax=Actinospica sp. TaxID=1872142 RepID=UPI002B7B3FDC|nr:hypothetical protein [Actinospica sp.]HWG22620.1 hypothetical protein [Actinospica sp.]
MNKISNKRRTSDLPQPPDFPLWQGIPRMVPPPFGPPRLPLVPAEPLPAALSTAQAAAPATSTATVRAAGLAAGLAAGPATPASTPTAWYSPAPIPTPIPAANLTPNYRRPPIHATPPPARPAPFPVVRTAILLGLALLAAAATYTALHRASSPAPTADPFAEAVSALANEPVIHYVSAQTDIYVTADGEEVGTSTRGGERINILVVGGAMYYEPVNFQNDWTPTPNDLDTPPPRSLAAQLRSALPGTHEHPTSVNGVPALAADTNAGELYVSATSPYRVLRIDSLTLAPMTTADDKQVYAQVIKDVRQLAAE